LVPAFSFDNPCVEKSGKTFRKCNTKIRPVTYKPDFIGDGWVMETKGLRRPRFDLVWKLFKKYLADNELDWLVMMPSNTEELKTCVEFIKHLNRGILQIPEDFKLTSRGRRESKTSEDEDGQPGNKRGHTITKNRKRAGLSTDVPVPVKRRVRSDKRK
jgi:hypothetical protein